MLRTTIALMGLTTALSALPAFADTPTKVRMCAGSESGNYTFSGNEIKKRYPGVEVIITGGSLDNLRRLMNNECDMAFSQSNVADLFVAENPAALSTIEPFKTVYEEYVHVLCPTATGWDSIQDMANAGQARMIVGPDGGGSGETWRSLRQANDKYGKIERLADKIDVTAASTVKDSTNTCMLWVSGLNSPDMQAANLISTNTRDHKPALRLIDVDDDAMENLLGSDGRPLYQWKDITRVEPVKGKNGKPTGGLYNNLIKDGWGDDTVHVPIVEANLMIRSDFKAAAAPMLSRLVLAIEDASPTIWNRVNPASQQ